MQNKIRLRKKYAQLRKIKYFDIKPSFFSPLLHLIKKKFNNKNVNLAFYYPSSFEVNVIKLFELKFFYRFNTLLPVVKNDNEMYFHRWQKNNVLRINKYGMLEPALSTNHIVPNIMLVPLLAFDIHKNRLGYGGGYYDRYLNKFLKINKKITTIGAAFSFQKYHNLPSSKKDVKLNYILTEKGII